MIIKDYRTLENFSISCIFPWLRILSKHYKSDHKDDDPYMKMFEIENKMESKI